MGKNMRLPPLKVLRVKDPKRASANPCNVIMSSVLGYNALGCAAIETQLRECMDMGRPPPPATNPINYHMARFKKYLTFDGKPNKGR